MIHGGRARLLGCLLVLGACASAPPRGRPSEGHDPLSRIDARTLFQTGKKLADQGDYIRAEQYFAAAMDKGYPAKQAIAALMEVCVSSSRIPSALQYGEPYLERHPRAWSLRLLVGSLYYALDRFDDAAKALERVLVDAPQEPATAHYLLALTYLNVQGATLQIKEHARRYLDLEPNGAHAEEAVDLLRSAVATPSTPEAPEESVSNDPTILR
ncbi:MAG: tetratricopeptide repeat protein [Myxococcales bacterium]|nr:tetratricopeptide repeat protein [Myxococcales bacterium]